MKMQINTMLRYHYIPTRKAGIRKMETNKFRQLEEVKKMKSLYTAGGNAKTVWLLLKRVCWLLKKLKSYHMTPTILLPRIFRIGNSQTNTHIYMFLAALFTNVKSKGENNQCSQMEECSPMEEWINKLCYIHIMEHYSAIKIKYWYIYGWTLNT